MVQPPVSTASPRPPCCATNAEGCAFADPTKTHSTQPDHAAFRRRDAGRYEDTVIDLLVENLERLWCGEAERKACEWAQSRNPTGINQIRLCVPKTHLVMISVLVSPSYSLVTLWVVSRDDGKPGSTVRGSQKFVDMHVPVAPFH